MKALKSQLASDLLADPATRDQLRRFLVREVSADQLSRQGDTEKFVIRGRNGERFEAMIVPKAKAA